MTIWISDLNSELEAYTEIYTEDLNRAKGFQRNSKAIQKQLSNRIQTVWEGRMFANVNYSNAIALDFKWLVT